MKYLLILSTLIVFGLTSTISAQSETKSDKTKIETKTFSVEGMTCQNCVKAVENTLGKIDGVQKYKVDLKKGEAVVEFDPNKVNSETIEKKFESTPYKVTKKENKTNPDKKEE